MRIYVLGSTCFTKDMVDYKDKLRAMGLDAWINPDYELLARGGLVEQRARVDQGEHAAVKREKNYLLVNYRHILESDAVFVVNLDQKGVKDYIGGNTLIEMGQAYVNQKAIYLLNGIPGDSTYRDEIECMDPVCLHGDLSKIQ